MDDDMIQLEADARKLVEGYAESGPYKLNPDSRHVDKIIKSLAKKKSKTGFFYCPCRMLSGDKEIDSRSICPCKYHVEEIEKEGICGCDLFVSAEYNPVSAV